MKIRVYDAHGGVDEHEIEDERSFGFDETLLRVYPTDGSMFGYVMQAVGKFEVVDDAE